MALEGIVATVMPQPLPGYRSPGQRLLAAGQILDLAVREADGSDLLVTAADGMVVRLKGLGHLAGELNPGDTVSMRVLVPEPHLTLELADAPLSPRQAASSPTMEMPAMRADQLAMFRMTSSAPDAAVLGESWRLQVLSALQQHNIVSQFAPDTQPAIAGRWIFPVFAWGGIPVLLRLVETDDEPAGAHRRRRRNAALWLIAELPVMGHIAVRVQMTNDEIFLLLAVEREEALQQVRDAMPTVVSALAAARLRLRRCQLRRGLPKGDMLRPWREEGPRLLPTALPAALFRAASEVMVALALAPPTARIKLSSR